MKASFANIKSQCLKNEKETNYYCAKTTIEDENMYFLSFSITESALLTLKKN